jgi:hypothetical protein
VQLRHVEKETTWEDHGFVTILDASGTELASEQKVQHNQGYSQREATLLKLGREALASLSMSLPKEGTTFLEQAVEQMALP